MKSQFYTTLFFFCCILNTVSFAQEPFDCISAMDVCDASSIDIEFENVAGVVSEEISSLCGLTNVPLFFLDDFTVWLKYKFISDGDFVFTLSSQLEDYDIDFVVFKSDSKSCDDLTSIRCMFTGSNVGEPPVSSCVGPTGLSATSTDTEEAPGCQIGNDNFLAPVEVTAGDVLYLAIIDFSQTSTYTIDHGGSAEISCEPVGVDELIDSDVKVYPNPATDHLHVEISDAASRIYHLEIFNSTGEKVMNQDFVNNAPLDISELNGGIYYVKIYSGNGAIYYKHIIKI